MAFTYADAVALLFGSREFTAREFRLRTGNPRAAKTLSELKRRGVVARTGRGRYRCLGPEERPDMRARESGRIRAAVLSVPLPKAWTGATAVEVWTDGRYTMSPSVLCEELELAVPAARLKAWTSRLRELRVPVAPRKRIGVSVRLVPLVRMPRVESVGGEPVLARREVLRLIREHPGLYGGAEEWLRARPRQA